MAGSGGAIGLSSQGCSLLFLGQGRPLGSSVSGSHSCCPAAAGLEPFKPEPRAAVHRAPGSREGHRLVPSPARLAGIGRRHSRPLHPLLEHTHWPAAAVHRHGLPSVQLGLVQARQRAGEHCDWGGCAWPGLAWPGPFQELGGGRKQWGAGSGRRVRFSQPFLGTLTWVALQPCRGKG
jgi:hypothetical protein